MRAHDLIRESRLPHHESERLMVAAIGGRRRDLAADPEVDDAAAARFRAMVRRRRSGEPLQYLEGTVQFGPIELVVDRRVLIPRPETEQLFELAAGMLGAMPAPVVVDLCTGSGNLALAIKHAYPAARVVATDASSGAIAVARENARLLQLAVELHEGDLFSALPEALEGRVDLIVSNPPYVGAREVAALPPEVRDHEPHVALVAGPDGDEVLARIAAGAGRWLAPGGRLICEINELRAAQVRSLFARFDPVIRKDLAGRPRFVIGGVPDDARAG